MSVIGECTRNVHTYTVFLYCTCSCADARSPSSMLSMFFLFFLIWNAIIFYVVWCISSLFRWMQIVSQCWVFFFVRLSISPEIFVRIYEILLYNFMLKDSLCQLDVTWLLNSIEWNSRHDAIEALIYIDMPMANGSFYFNTVWWIQFNGNYTSLTISNFIIVLLIFWSWPFCQSMNCTKTFPLNSWLSEDEV